MSEVLTWKPQLPNHVVSLSTLLSQAIHKTIKYDIYNIKYIKASTYTKHYKKIEIDIEILKNKTIPSITP